MKWQKKKISELCEIKGGKRLPKNHDLVESETNHPYIRARDIGEGIIDFAKPVYLQENTFNLISRYIVKRDDIVLTIVGANIGDVGLIPNELDGANLTENAVKLTEFSDSCFYKYLLYFFLLPGKKKELEQFAAGSAQGKLGIYKIKEIEVRLPEIDTQRKIASILSTYDDLIENNLKRIKLLKEKAFLSYKGILRSEKSEKVKLNEVTQVLKRGISPKYVEDDGILVFNQKCIRNHIVSFGDARFTDIEKKISEERLIQKFDTLVNSTGAGTLGRIGMNIQDEITSTVDSHITIVRANCKVTPIFLAQSLLSQESVIENMGEGSTNQTELSPRKLGEEIKISIPKRNVMIEFENQSIPNFNLIWNLQKQNAKLREARDILLPRLMSGEIVV
jgi:type I restriction enzyme S subunit